MYEFGTRRYAGLDGYREFSHFAAMIDRNAIFGICPEIIR